MMNKFHVMFSMCIFYKDGSFETIEGNHIDISVNPNEKGNEPEIDYIIIVPFEEMRIG